MTTVDYGVAKVRPATLSDAESLAPRLRAEDVREVEAAGLTPLSALTDGVKTSSKVYVIDHPECGVIAMFGVGPVPNSTFGAVWMLASADLLRVWRPFLRHSRPWVKELFSDFRALGNFVDARNTVHINWLRWLGFQFIAKHKIGKNGEEFIEFIKLKDD